MVFRAGRDISMIGQFSVGLGGGFTNNMEAMSPGGFSIIEQLDVVLYSAYVASDKVRVVSMTEFEESICKQIRQYGVCSGFNLDVPTQFAMHS